MKFQDHKQELLSRPDFRKEYRRIDLPFELSKMLIAARMLKGFTQRMLANALKTKQSSVARLEAGNSLPSLSFLKRIADVYETELIPPRFAFLEDRSHSLIKDRGIESQASSFYFNILVPDIQRDVVIQYPDLSHVKYFPVKSYEY